MYLETTLDRMGELLNQVSSIKMYECNKTHWIYIEVRPVNGKFFYVKHINIEDAIIKALAKLKGG